MKRRVVAVMLVAAIVLSANIGSVVAMDTVGDLEIWEDNTKPDMHYEEQIGDFVEESAEDTSSQVDQGDFDFSDFEDLFDDNANKNEDLKEEDKTEEAGDDFNFGDFDDHIGEDTNINLDDYFVKDNVYNDDFKFDDYFDYNPYNPGDFDFYDPIDGSSSIFDPFEDEEDEREPGEDFLKTGKTIHYAYGEIGKYTQYIDTGIKVPEGGNISYNQLMDLFSRISVEQGWKIIKDLDKMMIHKDGEIVIVGNKTLTENSIQKMFKDTDITIKIQDTRAGGKFKIADYLEMYGEIDVMVDGKKIILDSDPQLVNSRALLPIRSIGEALGAVVTWDRENQEATIVKDEINIIIPLNKSTITVNDQDYLLSEYTKIDKEDHRLLSIITLIVKELDAEIHWDSVENALVIKSNQTGEKINLDKYL